MEDNKVFSQLCLQMANEVEDIIQCPVCLETKKYMVQCAIGHHVCQQCRQNISQCPTCKSPFTGTKCFLIEDLSEIMKKMKLSIEAFNKNIETDNKVIAYRKTIRTVLTRLSNLLDSQGKAMVYFGRYLKNPNPHDNRELQNQIESLVESNKNILAFMDQTTKTLTDLKKKKC